jgi:polysaccharide export outer membrane protein
VQSKIKAAALALVAMLLTGAVEQGATGAAAAEGPTPAAEMPYTLDASDRVRITVFNEPALSGFFSISDSGNLSFPLIGDIVAKNMSLEDLQVAVHDRLAAGGYVKDARVSVDLVAYRPYYILGEVNRPGQYPYAAGLKLQQAIAAAGGYTYRANRGTAFIQRGNDATEQRVKIKGPPQQIRAGDTIRIGERYL